MRIRNAAAYLAGALVATIVVFACTPVEYERRPDGRLERIPTPTAEPVRFQTTSRRSTGVGSIHTVLDTKTGECWIHFGSGYQGGLANARPEACRE